MKKTLLTAFAVPLLATGLLAQSNQATMGASPHKVKQGEEIKFQVMVSPRSNVSGSVNVFIGPEGSTALNLNGGNGLTLGQTNVGDIGISKCGSSLLTRPPVILRFPVARPSKW
jgi:hypothetical protein